VTTSGGSRLWPRSARQALAMTLLLGAAGSAIAFLATRQGWAQVRTSPPRPLPASVLTVTGAALVPYADALVIAGLASLAAVLATRNAWRRVSGLILAALGAGLAASAFTLSKAAAVAAAAASVGPASNPGAGSVTQGSSASPPVPDVVGATPHVMLIAAGWQATVVVGALAMIAAGLLVAVNPARMAVMSRKYDAPEGAVGPQEMRSRAGRSRAAEPEPTPADSASIWEALSRGDDPTASGRRTAGA
jgi:uncharacterized membrane protein (TIGR02234 family)